MQIDLTRQPGDTNLTPNATAAAAEEVTIADLAQGLEALPSYHQSFKVNMVSKDARGNPTQGSLSALVEKVNTDKSSHAVLTMDGTLGSLAAGSGKLETYQVGETFYLISTLGGGQASCSSFPAGQSPFQGMLISAKDIVGSIHNAKLVKAGEQVNGIQADHYKFDQSNLTGGALSNARGDLWLAQEGKYIIKLTGTAVGFNFLTFQDATAALTFDYLVDQVGKVPRIVVPQECSGQPADLIIPSNLTDQESHQLPGGKNGRYT